MNKDHDWNRFCNALGTLAEIHEKELSEYAVAGYFKKLKDYPIEKVEMAISDAIGTRKWFPKPIELIEILVGGSPQEL